MPFELLSLQTNLSQSTLNTTFSRKISLMHTKKGIFSLLARSTFYKTDTSAHIQALPSKDDQHC